MDFGGYEVPQASERSWVPDWAANSVFYRMSSAKFLGSSDNAGSGDSLDLSRWYSFFDKMDITALSLSPVFDGALDGNGTSDYYSLDRRLGDIHRFRNVISDLHQRKFRFILDTDFTRTSIDFFAFQDIREYGQNSQFVDWYQFNSDVIGENKESLDLSQYLERGEFPRLNLNHPRVRKYVFDVAKMWLADYGIDGWRLASVSEVEPSFWWEFRRVCKEASSDCLLVAELTDGDFRKYVAPDLLDSAVNLSLQTAAIDSANDETTDTLRASLERANHSEWGVYKDITLLNVSSPDHSPLKTLLNEPENSTPLLTLIMTCPGIPCLNQSDVSAAVPLLANLRLSNPALAGGLFATLDVGLTHIAYARHVASHVVVVALNLGRDVVSSTIDMTSLITGEGVEFENAIDLAQPSLLTDHNAVIRLALPPHSATVLTGRQD